MKSVWFYVLLFFVIAFISFRALFPVQDEYVIVDATHTDQDVTFVLDRFIYGTLLDDGFQESVLVGRAYNENDQPINCDIAYMLGSEPSHTFEDSIHIPAKDSKEFNMDIILPIGETMNEFSFGCEISG